MSQSSTRACTAHGSTHRPLRVPSGAARTAAHLGAGAVAAVALGWVTTTGASAATVCTPTTEEPLLEVEPADAVLGSTLRVTGAGFCNEVEGGSRVAFTLDEAAYSRVDDAVHPDRTIWAVVDADPTDGTFTTQLQLPDGTEATSSPAYPEGPHVVRALTGDLKAGDPVREVRSSEFSVVAHVPTGRPEPVEASQLTPEAGERVTATLSKGRLTVQVADGQEGDWVFLSVLTKDGAPRYPWRDSWQRLDAHGRVTVDEGTEPVHGTHRLVVQDGNLGQVGELVGWDEVDFSPVKKPGAKPTETTKKPPRKKPRGTTERTPEASPTPVARPRTTTSRSTPRWAPPVLDAPLPTAPDEREKPRKKKSDRKKPEPAKPTEAAEPQPPAAPVRRWSGFWEDDELPADARGTELVVAADASGPVHVYVLDPTSSAPAGWVKSDADGRVRLDTRDLPPGRYRFSFQQGEDDYLGWAALEVAEDGDVTTTGRKGPIGSLVGAAEGDDGSVDGWLAAMGLMLLAGVGLGSLARRKVTR